MIELATNLEALSREERIQQLKALLFAWSKAFAMNRTLPLK